MKKNKLFSISNFFRKVTSPTMCYSNMCNNFIGVGNQIQRNESYCFVLRQVVLFVVSTYIIKIWH